MTRIDGRDAPDGTLWCYLCALKLVALPRVYSAAPKVCEGCLSMLTWEKFDRERR